MNKLIYRGLCALGITKQQFSNKEMLQPERVFNAPPLTRGLIKTIKRISPHLFLTKSEKSRILWECDQNGACWSEFKVLGPLFKKLPKPKKILEIGPGLGRSLVFLNKKLEWGQSEIHAYEGEGYTTKYTILGPRFEDSFCGDISMLKYVLEYNSINNVKIFNSKEVILTELPGPYDFIYSFYSVGYHWSLEYFLADLLLLMHEESVAAFIVPFSFVPFANLETLSYKIIECKPSGFEDRHFKMLIIGKKYLPEYE